MRRKILFPLTAFTLVFLFHTLYSLWNISQISSQWVQLENESLVSLYFKQQDFFLGFSYALAGAFTVYALLKLIHNRRCGTAGVVGGITLIGILYVGGCFLLGCCGSPMLGVYLGLLGPSFLGFTKPLVVMITTLSIVIGYFWMEKKSEACCEDENCLESRQ